MPSESGRVRNRAWRERLWGEWQDLVARQNVIVRELISTIPLAPPDLRVTALSSTSVTFELPESEDPDHSSFIIERSTNNSTWTVLASGITAATYTDSGLPAGVTRYYRLKDYDTFQNTSDPSETTSIYTTTTYAALPLATEGEGSIFDNDVLVITNENAIWAPISYTEDYGTFGGFGAGGAVNYYAGETPGSDQMIYKVWNINGEGLDGTATATFTVSS